MVIFDIIYLCCIEIFDSCLIILFMILIWFGFFRHILSGFCICLYIASSWSYLAFIFTIDIQNAMLFASFFLRTSLVY